MKQSVRRSGVIHTSHRTISPRGLTGSCFEDDDTRHRVGVHPTQIVALRIVSGPSGGALRDVPPNVHARAARDRDRRPLLSLPRLRNRSEGIGRRPRADVPESHTAEATGADGVCHQFDDPSSRFGALRGPAQGPARAGRPRSGSVTPTVPSANARSSPRRTRVKSKAIPKLSRLGRVSMTVKGVPAMALAAESVRDLQRVGCPRCGGSPGAGRPWRAAQAPVKTPRDSPVTTSSCKPRGGGW